MHNYNLTFVAPHRREEVLRRIRAIERFISAPGRAAAEMAAADLGLGVGQFYRLVRVWKDGRKPDALAGATKPRARTSRASTEQRQIVLEALRDMPDANVKPIFAHAVGIAARRSIAMLSANSVRKIIDMERIGRLRANSPSLGADVVINHCAIDLPVDAGSRPPIMPVATMVIDTAGKPSLLGIALSLEGVSPRTTARALLDAVTAGTECSRTTLLRIALDELPGAEWEALRKTLKDSGIALQGAKRMAPSVSRDATSLLGRKPAGIILRPGFVKNIADKRPATLTAGATPMSIADAEELMRERLRDPGKPNPLAALAADDRRVLVRLLARIATGRTER